MIVVLLGWLTDRGGGEGCEAEGSVLGKEGSGGEVVGLLFIYEFLQRCRSDIDSGMVQYLRQCTPYIVGPKNRNSHGQTQSHRFSAWRFSLRHDRAVTDVISP